MLSIIIADNDLNNLKNIKNYIDDNFQDKFIIKKIFNKEKDFFTFFSSNTVNLVLLEINFFKINSIQKIENFFATNPDVKFVVYGNLKDCDYLEKCLSFGAISYHIRPLTAEDLTSCLNNVSIYFEKFEKIKKEEAILNVEYFHNFNIFENKFLSILVNETQFNENEIEDNFEYFNINISPPYRVATLYIDNFKKLKFYRLKKEKHLLILKVLKLVEKYINNCKAFINNFNEIIIILGNSEDLEDCISSLLNLKLTIKESLNLNVSFGVGRKYENCEDINISYKESINALKYRCIVGYNSITPIDYVEPNNKYSAKYPYSLEKKFIYSIVIGNYDYSMKLLDEIYNKIKDFDTTFENIVSELVFQIILSINRLAFEQGLKIKNISNFFSTKDIVNINSIDEGINFLKVNTKEFCKYISQIRENMQIEVLEKAIKFLNENFTKKINYNDIGINVGCNPKFLKEIFVKNLNKSLEDYIEVLRIEKAKELILNSKLTDDLIAISVGFEDLNSFKKSFKKIEGKLITDFRYIHNK